MKCQITTIIGVKIDLSPSLTFVFSDLVGVDPKSLSLDITSNIIVGHADAKLNVILHIHHTAVGVVFSVDFTGKYFVCRDRCNHLGRSAIDGHVVTGAKLKRSLDVSNDQKWVLLTQINIPTYIFRKKVGR